MYTQRTGEKKERTSRPSINTSPIRAFAIPPFTLQLAAILTRINAERPPAFDLTIMRATFDAVPHTLLGGFGHVVWAVDECECPFERS